MWHGIFDMWWEVNILVKFQLPTSHVDTKLLSDRVDTCSTSATWSYKQQDLEEEDELINQSVT